MSHIQKTIEKSSNAIRRIRALGRRVFGIRMVRFWPYGSVPTLFLMFALTCQSSTTDIGAASWSAASLAAPITTTTKSSEAELVEQAHRNPIGLLNDALNRYDTSIDDYEGIFARQEVFKGKLQKLTVTRFSFRQSPFSVAMHVTEGVGRADRILYVEDKYDGKLLVHPTGFLGKIVPCATLDPDGPEARKNSSRSIKDFGLRNTLAGALKRFVEANQQGTLQMECSGVSKLGKRRVLVLRGTDRLGNVLIELDVEHLVPLRVRKYNPSGRLMGLFWFKELQLNQRLTDSTFSKKSNGLSA